MFVPQYQNQYMPMWRCKRFWNIWCVAYEQRQKKTKSSTSHVASSLWTVNTFLVVEYGICGRECVLDVRASWVSCNISFNSNFTKIVNDLHIHRKQVTINSFGDCGKVMHLHMHSEWWFHLKARVNPIRWHQLFKPNVEWIKWTKAVNRKWYEYGTNALIGCRFWNEKVVFTTALLTHSLWRILTPQYHHDKNDSCLGRRQWDRWPKKNFEENSQTLQFIRASPTEMNDTPKYCMKCSRPIPLVLTT